MQLLVLVVQNEFPTPWGHRHGGEQLLPADRRFGGHCARGRAVHHAPPYRRGRQAHPCGQSVARHANAADRRLAARVSPVGYRRRLTRRATAAVFLWFVPLMLACLVMMLLLKRHPSPPPSTTAARQGRLYKNGSRTACESVSRAFLVKKSALAASAARFSKVRFLLIKVLPGQNIIERTRECVDGESRERGLKTMIKLLLAIWRMRLKGAGVQSAWAQKEAPKWHF